LSTPTPEPCKVQDCPAPHVVQGQTLSSPSQRLSLRGLSPSGAGPEPEAVKGEGKTLKGLR